MRDTEKISFYSHFIGFIAAILGTGILLYLSKDSESKILISLIYGASVAFLFLTSSLYHAFKKSEGEISFWRKLDHFAIFVMIAGTYTPISYMYLPSYWKWSIITLQWALVLGGFFFKFFYLNAPRHLYTIIYLLMGWIGIIPIKYFLMSMPSAGIVLLIAGGLSFTIGAIFYMSKKPNIKIGFGFHEIFHLFILLGAFFHYSLVYITIAS